MKRFVQALLNKLFSHPAKLTISAGADAELERLKDFAAERGAEAGWHSLPAAEALKAVEAEVRLSVENFHGLPEQPDEVFDQQESKLRKEREETETKINTHQTQKPARPLPQAPSLPVSVNWRKAIGNVAVLSALIGVGLQTRGFEPGLFGYVALALVATFILINWTGWAPFARRLFVGIGYRLACLRHGFVGHRLKARARRLGKRLSQLQQRREATSTRRSQIEARIAQILPAVRGEFDYHYIRAEKAARLLAERNRTAKVTPQPERQAFEHNGISEPVPLPVLLMDERKQRAAAQSARSPDLGLSAGHHSTTISNRKEIEP